MSFLVNRLRGLTVRLAGPVVNRMHSSKGDVLRAPVLRSKFVSNIDATDTLEIGPLDCPVMRGPMVRYFDVLDHEALRKYARQEGRDDRGCPPIHYVSPNGDLSVIDRMFTTVFSSHVIEHQPDLIGHLKQVGHLLRRGGRYYMAVPDKRFCFDHFAATSTLDDVLAAHREKHLVHTSKSVLRARLEATHNDALSHWLGSHGIVNVEASAKSRAEADAGRARAGEYIDVHAWTFTPRSFLETLTTLHESGMIKLKPTAVYQTAFAELEFFAVLERS